MDPHGQIVPALRAQVRRIAPHDKLLLTTLEDVRFDMLVKSFYTEEATNED